MMKEPYLDGAERVTSVASAGSTDNHADFRSKVEAASRLLRTRGIPGLLGNTRLVIQSELKWRIKPFARWLRWTTLMRANKGVCSVEIKTEETGFFAQMTWCLFVLQYCEKY